MTRRARPRLRLQTQLLLLLFAFGIVPVSVAVGFGYAVSRRAIVSQSEEALEGLATRQARYLVSEIRRQRLILRTIAGQVAPALPRVGDDDMTDLLTGGLTEDGVFDGLRLIDSDRHVAAEVALLETAPDWPDHPFVGDSGSGLTMHSNGDRIVAYLLTVPVNSTARRLWLQGHVRAADFPRNFDIPLHLVGGVELGVFDDAGRVILVPNEQVAGELQALAARGAFDPVGHARTDLDGEPALGFLAAIPELQWNLVAALPLEVVLAPVDRLLFFATVGGTGLLLLIVVAGLAASRSVTTPLRQLAGAASTFGTTGTYPMIENMGVAETGALIESFQAMAVNLRRSRDEIDRLHALEMERAQQLATVGELASGVAHEIRNPLTGVLGALEVVRNRLKGDAKAGPLLEEAEAQLRRIESTTSQLLEYARPPELRRFDMDLGGVIERAVRVIESTADKTAVRIEVLLLQTPPTVRADPELLVQVLVNLLLNGLDVTAPKGVLRVEMVEVTDGVEVRVVDSGPGVPTDRRYDIFRPFFTTKNQGTGLGLSISQQIIARHGGSMWVEDSPGGGATFVIVLPTMT